MVDFSSYSTHWPGTLEQNTKCPWGNPRNNNKNVQSNVIHYGQPWYRSRLTQPVTKGRNHCGLFLLGRLCVEGGVSQEKVTILDGNISPKGENWTSRNMEVRRNISPHTDVSKPFLSPFCSHVPSFKISPQMPQFHSSIFFPQIPLEKDKQTLCLHEEA